MVIILQYMQISNHYGVLPETNKMLYVNYGSIKIFYTKKEKWGKREW